MWEDSLKGQLPWEVGAVNLSTATVLDSLGGDSDVDGPLAAHSLSQIFLGTQRLLGRLGLPRLDKQESPDDTWLPVVRRPLPINH